MFVCLPQPRTVECLPGSLSCERLALIYLPADAGEIDLAAAKLLQEELRRLRRPHAADQPRRGARPWRNVIALGSPQSLDASRRGDGAAGAGG